MKLPFQCLLSFSRIRLMALLLTFLTPVLLFAQAKTVTGTITDDTGKPLSGVSVSVKNGPGGTSTNDAGKFSLSVSPGATLVISSVNYEPTEIAVGSQTSIPVSLKASATSLNDVVVVGYATQKKVNLTGSVASISADDLSGRPVTNVSSALAGLAPGVFVRQSSGKPGSDGAIIRIRGTGTLNNSDPLVVIDGIIGTMDAVNPDDIQSMSILKDAASASIYGSLAANGVILITTKKGSRNKTSVTYNGYISQTEPISTVKFVSDYPRHMGLINEGLRNLGQAVQFPDARITEWQNANAHPNDTNAIGVPNWLTHPNTDWYDAVFNNKTAQNHNVSVSGGSDKVLYLLSMNYLNNPGIMNNTGTERYQLRANLEAKVNKFITLGTQTFASMQTYGLANTDNVFTYLNQTSPGLYPVYNGKYGYPAATEESITANNIVAYTNGTGGNNRVSRFNTTVYGIFNLFKGFAFESRVNYQTRFQEQNSYPIPINKWDFSTNTIRVAANTPDLNSTSYSFNKDYTVTIDQVLRYNTRLGKDHEISALAGYNEFYFNYYDFNASKLGLIDYNITTLGSAGSTSNQAGGQQYDRAIRSYFGRVNYAYKGKYLVEGNLRYDGSSRFAPDSRWGTFLSVSAGWRVSEENFFSGLKSNIQNLKLRGSWGKLGNNASGDYAYQAVYGAVNYSFNGIAAVGLRQGSIANPLLKWETTTQSNIGFEATFLRSFTLDLDWYNRLTDGILTAPPIPLVLGAATAPIQNTASVLNRGIEVNLNWHGKVGAVNLSVGGNFAYNKNLVTAYKGKLQEGYVTDASGVKTYVSNLGAVSNNGSNSLIVEDHMINEYFMQSVYRGNGTYKNGDGTVNINGGPKDGMIRTPDDFAWVQSMLAAGYKFAPVTSTATSTNKALLNYGDLIYADNNGDKIYGNTFDRKLTNKSSTPAYNFGLNLAASWKAIDISMLWAGSARMKYYWFQDGYNSSTTRNGWLVPERIADDHYYYNEANPSDATNNINGKYPRLKNNTDAQNNIPSDFWLYDASYIKLKNLQIGYTIPQRIASKAFITRARVYVSGENLLLLTKYPGLDPEIGSGIGYPTMKQFALGVTLSF
jgi:TonB-linked SusC/RagA family outer membrane protein